MKKMIFILATILLPLLSTHAQVATGGGELIKYPTEFVTYALARIQISKFERKLVERDAICSKHERLLKDKDLMQTYLKLSLFKHPKLSPGKCNEVDIYMACLFDKETQKQSKRLKNNGAAVKVLMSRYGISESEVNIILNFFDKMGKKRK
jgi:hypothetical protein